MRTGLFNFLKLAAKASTQEKLDLHFSSSGDGKKWSQFKRELKSKGFVQAVREDDRADEKLKRYVEMNHLHKTGKGPTFPVKSESSGKRYTVKYHPGKDVFTCSCPDWTIKRSALGGDCKHIRTLKSQSDMVKTAVFALKQLAGLARMGRMKVQTENNNEQAWHAGQTVQMHKSLAAERKLRG